MYYVLVEGHGEVSSHMTTIVQNYDSSLGSASSSVIDLHDRLTAFFSLYFCQQCSYWLQRNRDKREAIIPSPAGFCDTTATTGQPAERQNPRRGREALGKLLHNEESHSTVQTLKTN